MGVGAPTELLGHAQWMLLESESEELYCLTLFCGNISIATNSSSSTVEGALSFCLVGKKKNSLIQPDENRLIQTVKTLFPSWSLWRESSFVGTLYIANVLIGPEITPV